MEDIKDDIQEEPGSVGDVNLIDDHQFKALIHRTNHKTTLEQCKAKLDTRWHPLSRKVHLKMSSVIRRVESQQRSS